MEVKRKRLLYIGARCKLQVATKEHKSTHIPMKRQLEGNSV